MTEEEKRQRFQEMAEKVSKCNKSQLWVLLICTIIKLIVVSVKIIATPLATLVGGIFFFLTAVDLVKSGNVVYGVLLFFIAVTVIINLFYLTVIAKEEIERED